VGSFRSISNKLIYGINIEILKPTNLPVAALSQTRKPALNPGRFCFIYSNFHQRFTLLAQANPAQPAMNSVVNHLSSRYRRSSNAPHSHVLTPTTQASRAYTSAITLDLATRSEKHLSNHHIYTSNQLFTHVEPAQPAIEFIVIGNHAATTSSASAAPLSAISISGSIGQSKSQSSSTSGQTTAVGSTVAAGKNLTITANGDPSQGQSKGDGNLTTVGATLSAGKEATLDASGDLNLLASQNTSATNSTNSSSNASMGATLALGGSQNGLSFQAGAQGSKGKANGAEVTYNNTTITVGSTDKDGQPIPGTPGTLNIKSGGNTTLRGATASADTVNADIQGNLTIESLQDQSTYDSKQTSAGAGVSICIPPICYGTMVAINVNAGKTKINGDHLSVGQQSALRAGDGGFNVKVGGKTDLVGGVINSTDKAQFAEDYCSAVSSTPARQPPTSVLLQ
jgi:Hemagglutinin repeat